MSAWIWILMGLSAVGTVLLFLDYRGFDATERFGKALAILFILVLIGGFIFSFMNTEWR
jgi:amino acid transporter